MIILLTGLPGLGKTTILKEFLKLYKDDCFWVLSNELRNEEGLRVGFEASTSEGETKLIAHKQLIDSDHLIGDYRVDIAAVDDIFTDSVSHAMETPTQLFVLDEIGRMQMLSPNFPSAVDKLFETQTMTLATIRHGDEWAEKYKQDPKAVVIEVTEENREGLPSVLLEMIQTAYRVL